MILFYNLPPPLLPLYLPKIEFFTIAINLKTKFLRDCFIFLCYTHMGVYEKVFLQKKKRNWIFFLFFLLGRSILLRRRLAHTWERSRHRTRLRLDPSKFFSVNYGAAADESRNRLYSWSGTRKFYFVYQTAKPFLLFA